MSRGFGWQLVIKTDYSWHGTCQSLSFSEPISNKVAEKATLLNTWSLFLSPPHFPSDLQLSLLYLSQIHRIFWCLVPCRNSPRSQSRAKKVCALGKVRLAARLLPFPLLTLLPALRPSTDDCVHTVLSSVAVPSSVCTSSQTHESSVSISDLYYGTRGWMCLES